MKLTLRQEYRLWPLSSLLGILDLKTGVIVALLFALLNKVAGVYGLIAVATGAGGSFAQLSLYIYSVLALAAIAWGMRVVQDEDPKKTYYFAHLFFADHIFSTAWTVFFAIGWWLWTPHDGRRQTNSAAQEDIKNLGNSSAPVLTDAQRTQAAIEIWNHEKGFAAAVIVVSWLFKIYFALLIYSYATHLRKGSYRSLPLSRNAYVASALGPAGTNHNGAAYDALAGDEEDGDGVEDFYRVPLRTPTHSRTNSNATANGNGHRRTPTGASFADFVSAPGGRASRGGKRAGQNGSVSLGNGLGAGIKEDDDVLFDEDEMTLYAASSSSRGAGRSGLVPDATLNDEERALGAGANRYR
ncbi:hypothetical protein D9619_006357 [Psilocybe cf. subviscida]|uniref:DUF1753-domain-containing protein n=1 Tax=Psilocybe cf. subviscida TaxID=2480587 RepID=A0A8H5B3H0_9AGAR|nr:hypothetical protein D9619_006357 [Psilocybe cf. subviscida]